jgi:hypothetical protein
VKEKLKIYIDNMVWDLFEKYNIDLEKEFSSEEFEMFITGEGVLEAELAPFNIKEYAQKNLDKNIVKTDRYFAFAGDKGDPFENSSAGFGDLNDPEVGGRFASEDETNFLNEYIEKVASTKRPTGLRKHEADISLAARSLIGIILTKDQDGILKTISLESNNQVVDMNDFDGSKSLKDYINERIDPKEHI